MKAFSACNSRPTLTLVDPGHHPERELHTAFEIGLAIFLPFLVIALSWSPVRCIYLVATTPPPNHHFFGAIVS